MDKIPTVDFSHLSSATPPSQSEWKEAAETVFNALSGIGFVYLTNHGVPDSVIENAFTESKDFFELPTETKMKSLKDISKSFNGYAAPGQESLHKDVPFELRESYDICGNLRYFPDTIRPKFGSAMNALEEASKPLIKSLLRVLAISLKLEDTDFFVERTKALDDLDIPSYTTIRSLYYPPTWNKNISPGTVRCGDHSDYGTLTLLFQDAIGGLEVKAVNGEWVSADPIPKTVLVNTGDLLEFWSGGVFPATHHRVLIPEQELRQKTARQSIVYFVHPDDKVVIQPLSQSSTNQQNYQPVTAKEHAETRLRASYNY
ncbi:UPF0676 protein C1494.01 [Folsomia candida]|uniref:Feruloyl CoA ortho-hydroxylase 2 n=1 Tax=Folsomia candida TaxID=158441 RepID=A0A226F2G5_FOLCA|nr:UPF0676 protein C1494.01 [Folsomia candida]OXA63627.1 Feruloyl CoA ortho-hydroxylase 2 [Folsomia candida]